MSTTTLPIPAREYLLAALDNAPATLDYLLGQLSSDAAIWDFRPFPERFTLREVVAHLADWEDVFRSRFETTLSEDHPHMMRPDPEQRSLEKGYAQADPLECLARFREKRTDLVRWLRSLPEDAWKRGIHLDRIGDISLDIITALMLGHDSYHMRQISGWLQLPQN